METNIQEFIDILKDNRLIVKRYKLESIDVNDDRYDNFEFNENLLLSKDEYSEDELLDFIEIELFHVTTPTSCLLNGFTQPAKLENYIESEFEKFRTYIANNFNRIDKSTLKEIVETIKDSRNELGFLLSANRKNQFLILDHLISVKIELCAETIRYINNPLFITKSQVYKKKEKNQKGFENLTNLNQNQIVILFHYLREFGYIGKDMPKNLYAESISVLTGFATEKLRQDLSHIEKKSTSTDSTDFIENEFSIVRRSLEKVIEKLKRDSSERFPKP
jgi:hypothetical protein